MTDDEQTHLWVDPDPAKHTPTRPPLNYRTLGRRLWNNPRARKALEELSTRPVPEKCKYLTCTRLGEERHHIAPKDRFGPLAEMFGVVWLCQEHHLLITDGLRETPMTS
jgi:hypothetical protein